MILNRVCPVQLYLYVVAPIKNFIWYSFTQNIIFRLVKFYILLTYCFYASSIEYYKIFLIASNVWCFTYLNSGTKLGEIFYLFEFFASNDTMSAYFYTLNWASYQGDILISNSCKQEVR